MSVTQLPISQHACQILDRDIREITVTVIRPGGYLCGGTITNADGLALLLSEAREKLGIRVPVAIRAKPESPFIEVWRIAELASSNGCRPAFDVRLPDVEWPKMLEFECVAALVGSTNQVSVECGKDGIRLESKPVTREELRERLQMLGSVGRDIPISISVAEDSAHQGVIDILDDCQAAGLRHRLLGMQTK